MTSDAIIRQTPGITVPRSYVSGTIHVPVVPGVQPAASMTLHELVAEAEVLWSVPGPKADMRWYEIWDSKQKIEKASARWNYTEGGERICRRGNTVFVEWPERETLIDAELASGKTLKEVGKKFNVGARRIAQIRDRSRRRSELCAKWRRLGWQVVEVDRRGPAQAC